MDAVQTILVGNGPSLLGSGLGRRIDAAGRVVRFNNFKTAGHEVDVGSRTTDWFSYSPRSDGSVPAAALLTTSTSFTPPGVDRIERIPRSTIDAAISLVRSASRSPRRDSVIPSSGLVAALHFIRAGQPVSVAGFDHFSKHASRLHHYWVDAPFAQPMEHDGEAEAEIFSGWSAEGRLGFLQPPVAYSAGKEPSTRRHRHVRTVANDDLLVLCVLRTGGRYDALDVANLRRQVAANLSVPHRMLCLSDDPAVADVPLCFSFAGWWAKLELFRFTGPCVYFDLDTYIQGSLDPLAAWALGDGPRLAMLRRPDPRNYGSGVMAWGGDLSLLLSAHNRSHQRHYVGDDNWLTAAIHNFGISASHVDDILPVSRYDRWRGGDEAVVYFHGDPKPRQLGPPFFGIQGC